MAFAHLHVHTEYSLLDGSNKINEYVRRVKELGMTAAAITDHGVMYGVIDFYKAAKKEGIKPILGCEVYVAPGSRKDREASHGDDRYYHLILLAENNTGYANLMKIVSRSFTEGFYYKPRVDLDLLREFHEGIIACSACLAGELAREILRGNTEAAREAAKRYLDIFGEGNYFLELQDHGYADQQTVNAELLRMSRELGIPLVATNDCHYTFAEDAEAHDILLCVQTGKKLADENRMRYPGGQFYVKSEEEMRKLFPYAQEALDNTQRIADRCNVEIEFGVTKLPHFDVPEGYDSWTYLNKLCRDGMEKHYPGVFDNETLLSDPAGTEAAGGGRDEAAHNDSARSGPAHNDAAPNDPAEPKRYSGLTAGDLRARLDYELGTIRQMGYVDYFLIVWDYINFSREHGIMVGPGRGSAAGSIVAYALGITDIDPIRYNLLFERFLNPERVSMPDIDVDFAFERRGEVIDYVTKKYGKDRVMQIITFGTMAARGVIRDVGRVMDLPYGFVDSISKMVPQELGITLEKALKQSPDLRRSYETDDRVHKLIDMSLRLEGLPRHASVHAAGVVICSEPAEDLVPLARAQDGSTTTQFPMTTIEELGLLKMDFLGLRTLTVIQNAVEMANHSIAEAGGAYPPAEPALGPARPAENPLGPVVSMDALDYADPNVYRYICTGRTDGIFQLESGGMQNFMKELRPENFEDIIAGISLYRPGPMDFIPQYIEGKNNRDAVHYATPELQPILEPTYGCIVYQEQVMQIVRSLGGYTLGRSDLVRRAMSKKKQSVMEQERRNFVYGNPGEHVPGCVARGIDEKVASGIYDTMMDFAKYAFNKSHAACYAVVAYQTAWLKYYYPMEFMAALMTSVIDHPTKVAAYILACRSMKIRILPPDINEGEAGFSVAPAGETPGIRYALTAIKGVSRPVIDAVVRERRLRGPYRDLRDFLTRMAGQDKDVNRRTVENFIKAGALDCLGATRKQMMSIYIRILDDLNSSKKNDMAGQMSLFDIADEEDKKDFEIRMPDVGEFPDELRLAFEKEVLGIYVSGHPLEAYEGLWKSRVTATAADFVFEEGDGSVFGPSDIGGSRAGTPAIPAAAPGGSGGGRNARGAGYTGNPSAVTDPGRPAAAPTTGNGRLMDRQNAVIGGLISEKKIKYTKNDQVMAFLTIEDMTGTVEVIVFPRTYEESADLLDEDARVFIRGRVSLEEDKDGKLIAEKIVSFDDVPRRLWLRFPSMDAWKEHEQQILGTVAAHGGRDQVVIYIEDRRVRKTLPPGQGIRAGQDILAALRRTLGDKNVVLQ